MVKHRAYIPRQIQPSSKYRASAPRRLRRSAVDRMRSKGRTKGCPESHLGRGHFFSVSLNQCFLKYCTSRSCCLAFSNVENVPRLRRLPVEASFFREYRRNSPDFSLRIMDPGMQRIPLGYIREAAVHRDRNLDNLSYPRPHRITKGGSRNRFPPPKKSRAKVINLMDALKRSVSESNQKKERPRTTEDHRRTRSSSRSSKEGPTLVKSGKRSHKAA
jgi:hypothetical protein